MPKTRGREKYNPEVFQRLVKSLLEQTGESYRRASIACGFDDGAISRYMRDTRPTAVACVTLAGHFGVDPNDVLEAAGYERLPLFDRALGGPRQLTAAAQRLAAKVDLIEDPARRERVIRAVEDLVDVLENHDLAAREQKRTAGQGCPAAVDDRA